MKFYSYIIILPRKFRFFKSYFCSIFFSYSEWILSFNLTFPLWLNLSFCFCKIFIKVSMGDQRENFYSQSLLVFSRFHPVKTGIIRTIRTWTRDFQKNFPKNDQRPNHGGKSLRFQCFLWEKFCAFSLHVLKAFISQDFKLILQKINFVVDFKVNKQIIQNK